MIYKFPKSESLEAVKNEVARAREKHPSNEHLLAALTEEVGELNKAFLEGDFEHAKLEAIQVACVALRILEEGDSDFQKKEKFDLYIEVEKYIKLIDDDYCNLSIFGKSTKKGNLIVTVKWEKYNQYNDPKRNKFLIPKTEFEISFETVGNSSKEELFCLIVNKIEDITFDIKKKLSKFLQEKGARFGSIRINENETKYNIFFMIENHEYLHVLLKSPISDKDSYQRFVRIFPEILKNKSSLETIC